MGHWQSLTLWHHSSKTDSKSHSFGGCYQLLWSGGSCHCLFSLLSGFRHSCNCGYVNAHGHSKHEASDSTKFAGGVIRIKTQGLCQGNSAAPAGWGVVSVVLLNAHKQKGYGAKFLCPITKLSQHLAAVLYVDDTNLIHIDMEKTETVQEAYNAIQNAVTNWGNLFIASGGALKPAKCFFHLISFKFQQGKWKYAHNSNNEAFFVHVPLPDGTSERIRHLPISEVQKHWETWLAQNDLRQNNWRTWRRRQWSGQTIWRMVVVTNDWLGSATAPNSGPDSCITASFNELTTCLQCAYWKMLPLCGINRNCGSAFHQTALGFYGVGFKHPCIEVMIAHSNKILQHFGCQSSLGIQLQEVSFELILLELGLGFQPLQEDYEKFSSLTTHSWLKSLWEKLLLFGIDITIHNHKLVYP